MIALTGTVQYDLWKNVLSRLEVRWDHAANGQRAYGGELGNPTAAPGKKTGSELLSELATDKRYLPFLESASNPFGPVKIAARDLAEGIGRSKADGAALGRQAAVLADRLDHIAAEALVRHGVADHADVRLLANARHFTSPAAKPR